MERFVGQISSEYFVAKLKKEEEEKIKKLEGELNVTLIAYKRR